MLTGRDRISSLIGTLIPSNEYSTLMISSNPITSQMATSPKAITLGFGLQLMDFGGYSQSLTLPHQKERNNSTLYHSYLPVDLSFFADSSRNLQAYLFTFILPTIGRGAGKGALIRKLGLS